MDASQPLFGMPHHGGQLLNVFQAFLVGAAPHLVVHGQRGEDVVENGFVGEHGSNTGLPR